jgi:putative membrane protein
MTSQNAAGAARNAALKALLEEVTPAFEAHLDHAKQLQSRLASAGGSK